MKTRRHEILATAYGLMGTKGLEEVHARTVAAEIGVNHATVHYYFPKRTDLIAGVAEYALQILLEDRERFQEGATTSAEKIDNELALAEAYCRKQSRFVKVLASLYVASIKDANVRKKMKQIWSAWIQPYNDEIKGAKVKATSPYSEPELLMATVFGLGLASQMLDGQIDAQAKLDRVTQSMFG